MLARPASSIRLNLRRIILDDYVLPHVIYQMCGSRRLRLESAGHLGTLDPAASGLLLIAVGVATRCALLWQGGDKTYEGRLRLGVVTSTQDMTGEILERKTIDVDTEAVRQASRALLGVTEQIPPMVSALKQGGQRLYRLARRGVVVDRAPRRIEVTEWEWLDVNPPEASFRVRCSREETVAVIGSSPPKGSAVVRRKVATESSTSCTLRAQ